MKLQPLNIAIPEALREAYNESPERHRMRFALNQTDEDEQELLVMGFVGDFDDGLAADQIVNQLAEAKGRRIKVRINSPGGLAFDGLTIFNALLQHDGGVVTVVEGLAGSAASLIAMAGNPVKMMSNASMFIHRALGMSIGNSHVMRDMAEFLDTVDEGILQTYAAKTGLSQKRLNELLDGKVDGTTFTAKEAQTIGFADEVVQLKRPKKASENSAASTVTSNGNGQWFITAALGNRHQVQCTVPGNPPNGDGEGVEGEWSRPSLSDFTDESWDDLGPSTRAAIARHFAFAPENLEDAVFGDLKLPHHFPPNHDDSGKASLNGVRNALSRLPQTGGISESDRSRIESHLNAHLPDEDEEDSVDDALWNEIELRKAAMRLEEIGHGC